MKVNQSWLPAYRRPAISRRAFLSASAAGVGAVALIACGGTGGSDLKLDDAGTARVPGTVWNSRNDWKLADETKEAVRGGIYRSVRTSDMSGHFDAIALMSSEIPFASHMYEQLMVLNRRPGIDPATEEFATPIGGLAEKWEFSDDGSTVTFTLRPNVRFHNIAPVNGRVMDMDDWRTSQERHQAIGVYRTFLNDVLDKTEYPDARHMVWKLKFPYQPINEGIVQDQWGYPIQPKELNANPDLARTVAIGTGFKILDKFQPAITHEYRKFPQYWGGDPFIDRWHFPIIPEYANRYAQFIRENIMDFTPTPREVLQMHKDAPQAVVVGNPPGYARFSRYLFGILSPEKQATNDPRVRIAIRRSIDFKSIGTFLSNKAEFEAAGLPVDVLPLSHLPQNPAWWLNPEKGELGKLSDNYLYDPAEAKKLNVAAGHSGLVPLTIAIQLATGNIPEYDGLVVDSLKASNTFDVNTILSPTSAANNKYRIERDFDGIVWIGASDSEVDYLLARDYSSTFRADGSQAYAHPKTEAFLMAQRRELDFEKRAQVLKDLQLWFAEWFPSVPAQHLYTSFGFRWPWVRNSNWGEKGTTGKPNWGAHMQWLDPEMPNRDKGAS